MIGPLTLGGAGEADGGAGVIVLDVRGDSVLTPTRRLRRRALPGGIEATPRQPVVSPLKTSRLATSPVLAVATEARGERRRRLSESRPDDLPPPPPSSRTRRTTARLELAASSRPAVRSSASTSNSSLLPSPSSYGGLQDPPPAPPPCVSSRRRDAPVTTPGRSVVRTSRSRPIGHRPRRSSSRPSLTGQVAGVHCPSSSSTRRTHSTPCARRWRRSRASGCALPFPARAWAPTRRAQQRRAGEAAAGDAPATSKTSNPTRTLLPPERTARERGTPPPDLGAGRSLTVSPTILLLRPPFRRAPPPVPHGDPPAPRPRRCGRREREAPPAPAPVAPLRVMPLPPPPGTPPIPRRPPPQDDQPTDACRPS